MAKQTHQPLVSIVVPVYNVEAFVPKCLDSILGQTYSNIEVIIVNDGSSGDINSIAAQYQKNHNNIKLVDLGTNRGLFRARLEGFKSATGNYLLSVDGDDSISVDYVRTMVTIAEKSNSDVVIPETVIENDAEKFIFNFANDLPFEHLDGAEGLSGFFEQQGNNYIWHRVAAPLYSRKIMDLAVPFLDTVKEHVTMCEDVLFSTVLWSFATRVDRSQTAYYYYYQHESSSTRHSSIETLKKRIQDINTVFNSVERFLKSQSLYAKFEAGLMEWMNLYSFEYHIHIDKMPFSSDQKKELVRAIKFGDKNWNKKIHSRFYSVTTKFNNGLEKVKQKLIDEKIEVISFDLFDTLVTRPFLRPSDLFYLLNREFKSLDKQFRLQSFYDIRIKSEQLARAMKSTKEDVSLALIYEVMQNEFAVSKVVTEKMLEKELEYEIRYCSQRQTAKELYDLALYLGKKVIVASDMYLPKKTLESILLNSDFSDYKELYVSSHHGTTKATQNLYRHIATDLYTEPGSILHIGDNYESDFVSAKSAGWNAVHLPKTTEASPNLFEKVFGEDTQYAQNHLGVTLAYAIAVNKYFDNPFRSFLNESNYNCSPYFMGYLALGLSILGFSRWMVDDIQTKHITSLVFLGRDGHLPMRVFDIFKQKFELPVQAYYLPTSRKATIPLSIFGEANISDIKTFNYLGSMTDSILASLKPYLKDSSSNDIKDIDYSRINKLHRAFINTYRKYFGDHAAVMDIGYSGRPEHVFANLFGVPIETYFMYTDRDEAKWRLGKAVNSYSRLKVGSLREKLISEIGPSCIGYRIVGDKVEPIFDEFTPSSYYEKYFLSESQRGAIDFTQDYLALVHDHLNEIDFGDNSLTMRPLDQATVYPAKSDKEMYRGVMHEDGVAMGEEISLFDQYYGGTEVSQNENVLAENAELNAELASHMGIKRSAKLLAGNIKRRVLYGKKR